MEKSKLLYYNRLIAEYEFSNLSAEIKACNITVEDGMWEKSCLLMEDYDNIKYHEIFLNGSLMRVIYKLRNLLTIQIILNGDLTIIKKYPKINIANFSKIEILDRDYSAFIAVGKLIEWHNLNK